MGVLLSRSAQARTFAEQVCSVEVCHKATSPQRADQQIEQLQTAAGMALTVGASLLKTAGGIISYGLMK